MTPQRGRRRRPGYPSPVSRGRPGWLDVAGQHVVWLHLAQRLGIAGIGATGTLGGDELGAHVPREIDIRRVPGLGVGILVDEVAQLGDDLTHGGRIEHRDVGHIDEAPLVEETSSPSSALCTVVRGVWRPTTSWCMMAACSARPVRSS
jgi:hypothetical protein